MASISRTVWSSDVYSPSDDTFLLVDTLQERSQHWHATKQADPMTFVEIGCGSGFVSCSLSCILKELDIKAHITAVDINPSAIDSTRLTLLNHGICDVDLIAMDLLGGLSSHWMGKIDILIFNPPYVPTPDDEVHQDGIARSWAGGERGRRVIDRLLQQLPTILAQNGEFFLVTIAQNNPQEIIDQMKGQGFIGQVLGTRAADEEALTIVHLKKESSGSHLNQL